MACSLTLFKEDARVFALITLILTDLLSHEETSLLYGIKTKTKARPHGIAVHSCRTIFSKGRGGDGKELNKGYLGIYDFDVMFCVLKKNKINGERESVDARKACMPGSK